MSNTYGYGREEVVYARHEDDGYGIHKLQSGADALVAISTDFKETIERMDRKEKGTTRSVFDRVTQKKSAEWSINKFILPSGTAGTPPDDRWLFASAMGTHQNNAGVSDVFSLTTEPAVTLDIVREIGTFRECIRGGIVNTMEISFGGGEEPKVAFSGPAKDLLHCGRDTLDEASAGDTQVVVHDSYRFEPGMYISVGDDDNTGSGYLIASINHATHTLTTVGNVTADDESAVIPTVIVPVTGGDIIPVIVGSVNLGTGGTKPVTAGRITLNNNALLRNDEFGSASPTGVRYADWREVTFSFDIYLLATDLDIIGGAKQFVQNDIAIILGGTAGKILTIDMDQCEFEIPSITIPEEGETTITITGKALGTSGTGNDELILTFT